MSPPLARCNPEPVWSHGADPIYRYRLERKEIPLKTAQSHGTVNFIMLNPSTATAQCNDKTVGNCEQLAQSWGYENLIVTNLFAYRDTNPDRLRVFDEPVGPDNDNHLLEAAREADLRIAAWGGQGDGFCFWQDRAIWLRVRLHVEQLDLKCWGRTKAFHPKHPGRVRNPGNFPLESLEDYALAPNLAAILAAPRPQQKPSHHLPPEPQ
ncbi:MAG: DUF1643 domain-containing protein [Gammaproteobacteria bacterium]|nr:DUF1643 domain-containing protein [Gammaproteobacteria bacterium]